MPFHPMPGVNLTPTKRPIWFRLRRLMVLAWCWYEIRCLEDWVSDCAKDGLMTSEHLRGCRARLEELRAEQSVWKNA